MTTAYEAHYARHMAANAHATAAAAAPTLYLQDGSFITGTLGVTHEDTSHVSPGAVLRPHMVTLNCPPEQAIVTYSPTWHPRPTPTPAPTCSSPPMMNGGSNVGDTIWAVPGKWSNTQTVTTVVLRNGSPLGTYGPDMAHGYKTTTADAGATFTARDTATGSVSVTATSPNSVVVAGPTPPPPPPPGGLVLPVGWGITAGALLASSLDPANALWDSAGTPAFGYMNNVTCSRSNIKYDANGLHVSSPGAGTGATMTTLPPKWGKGGAPTGLDFGSVIWRVQVQMPGSGTTGIGWGAIWSQCADWQWPAHGECDWVECSGGWTGGAGAYSSHYHSGTGTWDWGGSFPVLTDKTHEIIMVRDVAAGWMGAVYDGQPMFQTPLHETARHFGILTMGQGSTPHPATMTLTRSEFYAVA